VSTPSSEAATGLTDQGSLILHSYDASLDEAVPAAVVRAADWQEVQRIVEVCLQRRTPVVIRGAGTGYSGGALSDAGVVVTTVGLDGINAPDTTELEVEVQAGAVLRDVRTAAGRCGLRYLPDPSSYEVCTIGGNVAENAGGPHALGQGPTANFVRRIRTLVPDRGVIDFDENDVYHGLLDLRALIVGAEGTLCVVSRTVLRLRPEADLSRVLLADFADQQAAGAAVTAVLDAALLPSALDMFTGAYLPSGPDTGDRTQLFIGLEGWRGDVAAQAEAIGAIVERHGGTAALLDVPAFLAERAELVRDKVRRVVQATGRPRYYLFDAVAPRSALTGLLAAVREAARRHGLPLLNTFHAGDGNIHPTVFYDPSSGHWQAGLQDFLADVLSACARLGGALSGEHGIGTEKTRFMPLFHTARELAVMRGIKEAFDPSGLLNPGKILPDPGGQAPPLRPPAPRLADGVHLFLEDGLLTVRGRDATFEDVARALADTGFELPWEPLWGGPGQSVLGAVDSAVPGVREWQVVRARDLVVGAELADAHGARLRVGGRCAKDVSGYELRRPVFGGRGRLGRLTEVTLRPLPRVRAAAWLTLAVGDAREALAAFGPPGALPWGCLGLAAIPRADAAGRTLAVQGRLEARGGDLAPYLARAASLLPGAEIAETPSFEPSLAAHLFDPADPPVPRSLRIVGPDDLDAACAVGEPFYAAAAGGGVWARRGLFGTPAAQPARTGLDEAVAAAFGRRA
jgi:glycolate oxidase